MMNSRRGFRGPGGLLTAVFLWLHPGTLPAQALLSPTFQGTCGSNGMTAGTQSIIFSASQTGASALTSGADLVQSGFFGFMTGIMPVATALFGQSILLTIVTPAGVSTAYFPAGSVPAGTVVSGQIRVSPPAAGAGFTAVADTGIQIDPPYQPSTPVTVSLSYASAVISRQDQLIVARFDAAANVWVPLFSSVDQSNRVVRTQTGYLGTFQLMQAAPSSSVSSAKAFPNPLRPALGHTAMAFIRLPADSRIRIYTIKGVLVKELTANASGMASWDGTNRNGGAAASGVYQVLAQGSGESRTLAVAIER